MFEKSDQYGNAALPVSQTALRLGHLVITYWEKTQ